MGFRYALKRSKRSRSMRVSVRPDGTVSVSAAMHYSALDIEHFLKKHATWIDKEIARAKNHTIIKLKRRDIIALKTRAHAIVRERLAHFNRIYGYAYSKIRVGAAKTRWGSCSARGSICFNYKIAALPAHLADYIVVHELCHLGQMNHSKAFWKLVARTVPDHKTRRTELRNIVMVFT